MLKTPLLNLPQRLLKTVKASINEQPPKFTGSNFVSRQPAFLRRISSSSADNGDAFTPLLSDTAALPSFIHPVPSRSYE
jgi:hypothetical protein